VAALAQVTDFSEHALLAGVGFDVLAVRAETESEPDIADLLPAGGLVAQGVSRAFPDSLALHCETAAMMVMTTRPAAEAVSSDSATEINATPRFSKSSSNVRRSLTDRVTW